MSYSKTATAGSVAEQYCHINPCKRSIWVDVMSEGVDKGLAVRELQAAMGIDATQTMAFGDYLNDYEMLQAADWSFAMSNAHPDILDVANYTAPANHENGVIRTVRSVLGL